LDHAAIATRATQMVERLSEENRSLRQELEGYINKVANMQKLEGEVSRLTEKHKSLRDDYESLTKRNNKREHLEKILRLKLETEIKKLREINKDLKEQLERTLVELQKKVAPYKSGSDSDHAQDLLKKDAMIAKLIKLVS